MVEKFSISLEPEYFTKLSEIERCVYVSPDFPRSRLIAYCIDVAYERIMILQNDLLQNEIK